MISLGQLFFPAGRPFAVYTTLSPGEVRERLAARIQRPRWLTTPPPETVLGKVSDARLEAFLAGQRNSFRPILRARIEAGPAGGSVIRGTIGPSRWVNVFMLVWLVGALSLAGILVVVSVVGFAAGASLMRDGSGRPVPPAIAVLVSVGAFLLFGGAGLILPFLGRRLAARDPDRLLAFVVAATDGSVDLDGAGRRGS